MYCWWSSQSAAKLVQFTAMLVTIEIAGFRKYLLFLNIWKQDSRLFRSILTTNSETPWIMFRENIWKQNSGEDKNTHVYRWIVLYFFFLEMELPIVKNNFFPWFNTTDSCVRLSLISTIFLFARETTENIRKLLLHRLNLRLIVRI